MAAVESYAPANDVGAPQEQQPAIVALMESDNIAADMSEDELGKIAQSVIEEYDIDKKSRSDWEDRTKEAMALAMMVASQKNYPFEKASNIQFPLLVVAALQFNARAYPAIVQGNRVAKCTTWGQDPQGMKSARAKRVSEHMSYQLLAEQPEWEEDTDKLLIILPIVGCAFRKVYYDPALGRNCTRLVTADRLVVNYYASNLQDVPRVTEQMMLYPNEIVERIRSKRFVEFDYSQAASNPERVDGKQENDTQDASAPHLFLEQHRLLDLDEDGYAEPYIVTVHKDSQKVCRIKANFSEETLSMGEDGKVLAIRKQEFYVKYQFLPSPDGGFYGWGFGWLLADIGEGTNTLFNQMLDAGHMSIMQGGLVSGSLGIKDKSIRLKPGEWKVVHGAGPINQAIQPINYPGPSETMFKLLGLLIDAGKEIGAIKDVLTGEVKNNMPVGTTLALIEQGMQVFTAIYKRVHRALKAELGILARLNRKHLSPERYNAFFDDPQQQFDPAQDYSEKDMDIVPVSDPNMATKMQALQKAEFVREVSKENPTINPFEATRRVLEAAQVEDIETLMMPPPAPDPAMEMLAKRAALVEVDNKEADTIKKHADAMKSVASIEQGERQGDIAQSGIVLDAIKTEVASEQAMELAALNGQGRVPGMEGQPGDAMGAQAPVADLGAGGTGPQGAPVPVDGPAGGGMGQPATAGGL